MVFYDFLRWNLAWMATISLLWPLNIGLAALAYRVRRGETETPMEDSEFWLRCTLGSGLLALATVVLLAIDYWLAEAEFPAGVVHMIVYGSFVGLGWWLCYLFFDLDDPFEGLSLFILYLYLPLAILWPLNKLIGLWNPWLNYLASWLKDPAG